MIAAAIILFFGISLWVLLAPISDARVYLVFDIVSVWLMILIVFWLFVVEKVLKETPSE